jgi:hypothetical protein
VVSSNIVASRTPNATGTLFTSWNGFDYEIGGLSINLPAGTYWLGLNSNFSGTRSGWDNTTGGRDTIGGYRLVNSANPAPGLVVNGNLAFTLHGHVAPGGGGTAMAVNRSTFSGTETIEDFDPNFGRLSSPVVFNGVTYTSPASGQLWSDINWTANGFYTNLPGASAGFGLNDLVGQTNLQVDFTIPVNRVGVFAATSPVTTYTMTAYNDALIAIGSVTGTMPAAARAVFLGLQADVNIRRVVITEPTDNGQITVFDDLRFEPALMPAPVQTSPADGTVFSHFPRATTLTWNAVPGAASYVVEIDCFHCTQAGQWSSDVGPPWIIVPGLTTNSYTFDFVGAQPGRWRVWAVDANGVKGQVSGWFEFSYTI